MKRMRHSHSLWSMIRGATHKTTVATKCSTPTAVTAETCDILLKKVCTQANLTHPTWYHLIPAYKNACTLCSSGFWELHVDPAHDDY